MSCRVCRNRRARDGRCRDGHAALADTDSAVPPQPNRSAGYDGYDGYDGHNRPAGYDGSDYPAGLNRTRNLDAAGRPYVVTHPAPATDRAEGVGTPPHHANPKRLLAIVAAAAAASASRMCPDWSDHDSPFR